jgi:3-phenylpropionate/trans-cinnamate dioxygenase ferredoxin subunit
MTKQFVKVARESEIPEGESRVFAADGNRVLICRVAGELYAIDDVCTHDDGPLGDGWLDGYEVECPRHGARFDVRSGAVCRMPAASPVSTYPLKVEDGYVLVEVDLE